MGNTASKVWESEAIEHIARWAAEEGDTALESWCDDALAGLGDELVVLDYATHSGPPELALHMERGKNLGWSSREAVSRG